MIEKIHIPVLPAEVRQALAPRPGETYVDCTAGLGGHAAVVAGDLGPQGRIILNDFDAGNLADAAARIRPLVAEVITIRGNFAALPSELRLRAAKGEAVRADVVLADIGFASSQVDDPARGLSFLHDGPLDMRLDPTGPITAADLANRSSEQELRKMLFDYGQEREAGRIARAIVARRSSSPLVTTRDLADVVRGALPPAFKAVTGHDPATRTFQAFRIAVNDELGNLDGLLDAIGDGARAAAAGGRTGPTWLNPGARVGIISFHSLEDRAVKRAFEQLVKGGLATDVLRGAVEAGEAERHSNPRSRSAKLRVIRLSPG